MSISNGQFAESMIDRIVDFYDGNEGSFYEILYMLRAYYRAPRPIPVIIPFVKRLVDKIDQRVRDVLGTIDPMWFVIAMKVRYEGGSWKDMEQYGVKKTYTRTDASSYKVEKSSSAE